MRVRQILKSYLRSIPSVLTNDAAIATMQKTLHNPPPLVAAQSSAVLRLTLLLVLAMRRYHLDFLFLQLLVEVIAVLRSVSYQALRLVSIMQKSKLMAPVVRIHNTAFKTRRAGTGLRPGQLARILSHCSSRIFSMGIPYHGKRHHLNFEVGSSTDILQ